MLERIAAGDLPPLSEAHAEKLARESAATVAQLRDLHSQVVTLRLAAQAQLRGFRAHWWTAALRPQARAAHAAQLATRTEQALGGDEKARLEVRYAVAAALLTRRGHTYRTVVPKARTSPQRVLDAMHAGPAPVTDPETALDGLLSDDPAPTLGTLTAEFAAARDAALQDLLEAGHTRAQVRRMTGITDLPDAA